MADMQADQPFLLRNTDRPENVSWKTSLLQVSPNFDPRSDAAGAVT